MQNYIYSKYKVLYTIPNMKVLSYINYLNKIIYIKMLLIIYCQVYILPM